MDESVPEVSKPRDGGAAPKGAGVKARIRTWFAWTLVVLVAASALYCGVPLRRWAWDQTTNIRFLNSVNNAIEWGRYANRVGVLNVYDGLVERYGTEGDYAGPAEFALDYPPLRLLIASWWAGWAQREFPPPRGREVVWQSAYEFTRPMLELNLACEILASVGMFLLVYRWVRVCRATPAEKWWRLGDGAVVPTKLPSSVGLFPATLAALLLWFNPAVIFNAHVYPQWDVWLLPAFIFGAYFVLRGWWLAAGFAVGIGAMAKGQILFAAPLLIAMPLLRGQVMGALRILIGMGAAIGLVIWPWLLRTPGSQDWMMYLSIAGAVLVIVNLLPRKGWKWLAGRVVLALSASSVVYWCVMAMPLDNRLYALGLVVFVALCAVIGSRWWTPTCLAALWAGGLALTVPLYGASMAWYEVGIKYGTRHWRNLFWCHASNLGSILQVRFRWGFTDVVDLSWVPWLGLSEPVPIRTLMILLNAVLLGVVIVAAVRHRVRHDPKLFVALVAPFMLAYTILPQMIERYLLWPAALMSAYAAISLSGLVLWLVLSVLATLMTFEYMLGFVRSTPEAQTWLPYLQVTFPDIGWGVLVLAGVVLFMACTPTVRRGRELPLSGALDLQCP